MKLEANSLNEYYEMVPEVRKASMYELRSLIIDNAPDVNEVFKDKHKLPFYDIDNEPFIAVASQKHHISFYLNEPEMIQEYVPRLGKVSSGKNCLRFKNLDVIERSELKALIIEAYKKRVKRY